MDLLAEFVFILSLSPSLLLDSRLPPKSKARELYDAVAHGRVHTDAEAAMLIYQCEPKAKKYLMLKRSLINKLSDLVLLLDMPYGPSQNAIELKLSFERQLSIAEKMLAQNVFHNAERILQHIEPRAEELHLVEVSLKCLKLNRRIFALKGNLEKTTYYQQQYAHTLQLSVLEDEAVGFNEIIYSRLAYLLAPDEALARQAMEFATKLEQSVYQSPTIRLSSLRMRIVVYRYQRNWEAWANIIHQLDTLLDSFPFLKSNETLIDFWTDCTIYRLRIADLDLAERYLNQALALSDYRAFNKFKLMTLSFELKLKQRLYAQAAMIVAEVEASPQFAYLYPPDKATWLIRKAFLFFLSEEKMPGFNKKFLNEYLNSTPVLAKDKLGYNLLFLVGRLLLTSIHDTSDLETIGNNLSVYYQRYLKTATPRTRVFFKSISYITRGGLREKLVEEQNQKFWATIHAETAFYDECEWAPYTDLWTKLLATLPANLPSSHPL